MLVLLLLILLLLLAYVLVPSAAQRAVRHLPHPASTLPLLGNALDVRVRHGGRVLEFLLAESRRQQQQSSGDAWVVQAPGRPVTVVLTSPAAFEHVLRRRFDDFGKGPLNAAALRDVLGRGIFAVDGARWRHQRKVASCLFSMQQLRAAMTHAVADRTAQLCAELARHVVTDSTSPLVSSTSAALDVKRLLDRFAMDVFTKVGFGVDLRSLEASAASETVEPTAFLDAFERVSRNLMTRFMVPAWLWRLRKWLNVGVERQIAADVRVIDAFTFGVIQRSIEAKKKRKKEKSWRRRIGCRSHQRATHGDGEAYQSFTSDSDSEDNEPRDLISLFLENEPFAGTEKSNGGDGGDNHSEEGDASNADTTTTTTDAMTHPTFIRDMTVNLLTAGRDTTSQSMAWFLLLLNRHPAVLRRVREELAEKLPELMRGPLSAVPSMEDVAQLPFLEAALRESVRLHPVVPMNSRTALRGTTLHDGTHIKAGTRVVLPHYVTARLSSVWGRDAEQYNPDRWLDTRSGQLLEVSPFKFSSFLAGPRMCLGMKFAMLEMKFAMAAVLSKFDIATVKDPFTFTYTPSITLSIDGPVDVTVRRVRNTAYGVHAGADR